ncbi:hypothetical protein ACN4FV_11030, partial [Aliarcobacter butzleri]|uniref:hypothetical protein n=1 Tax=Aliarcobacter butzleri TaxID=28197 RepID=UPI003AF4C0F6
QESLLYEELKILGVTQFYSVVLSGYNIYNLSDIIKLLDILVKFTFRYSTICGKNPNKLENLYANLTYEINNKTLKVDEVI